MTDENKTLSMDDIDKAFKQLRENDKNAPAEKTIILYQSDFHWIESEFTKMAAEIDRLKKYEPDTNDQESISNRAKKYFSDDPEKPELKDFTSNVFKTIMDWIDQQPENSKTFTIDDLEQACREAWNAGRFAMSAYMEDQQYTCLEAWIKQYKAKIMGEK